MDMLADTRWQIVSSRLLASQDQGVLQAVLVFLLNAVKGSRERSYVPPLTKLPFPSRADLVSC